MGRRTSSASVLADRSVAGGEVMLNGEAFSQLSLHF